MLAPRPVTPRLVAAFGAFATLSCSGLLGIDDDQASVARELCTCRPETIEDFDGTSCEDFVAGRLETTDPTTRREWMQQFDATCTGSCDGGCWETVFKTPPTCTDSLEKCVLTDCADCCKLPADVGGGVCA